MENIKLSNGVEMPILGYGVYQVDPVETERCVSEALGVGYRLIDTAQAYMNEEGVGAALAKSGIDRKKLFIVSKVWITNFGYEKTKVSLDESLRKLGTDYIDLMLLHQPVGDVYGAWRALEEYYRAGRLRAIGVSNFGPDRLVDFALHSEIAPMINQVETHVFNQQVEAKKWMEKYHCQIMSWGPFAEGRNGMFTNTVLVEIGKQYGKSAAQVALRYLIQRGVVVIPKSTHKERMEQNFDVFDFTLNDKDMESIASLDEACSQFFSHYDPQTIEFLSSVKI